MNKALSLHYSITLPHPVWRMDIDQASGTMVVEQRDQHTGTPYYTVFNYENGVVLRKNIQYGDRWWTLSGLVGNHVLLSYYSNPEQPDTSAVVAISCDTGLVAWEKYNALIDGIDPIGPVVQLHTLPNGFKSLLNAHTGEIVKNYLPGNEVPYAQRDIYHPQPVDAAPLWAQQVEGTVGAWQHLNYNHRDYWAVHQDDGGLFKLRLIVHEKGILLHDEVIIDNLAKLLPETFFVLDQRLFVLADNKRQITAYIV